MEDLDVYSGWPMKITHDDQLWVCTIQVAKHLDLDHADINLAILYQLLSMGVWDWHCIHCPNDTSTRSMRYAAVLADVQDRMLRAKHAKAPSPLP